MHLQTRAVASLQGGNANPALAMLLRGPQFGGPHPGTDDVVGVPDFWRRYHFEYAWLSLLPGMSVFSAKVLAVRIGASQPGPPGVGSSSGSQCSDGHLAPFRACAPNLAQLQPALHALGLSSGLDTPEPAELAYLVRTWPLALAVEVLLASGGDDRLVLDPATGLNRYGCAPWPRPEVVGFASCTASSLAEPQFLAAEQARRHLIIAALATDTDAALTAASAGVAERILAHFAVSDVADAILAASGTDAALIVTSLLAAERPDMPLTSILVSPAETGSGVPDAVQGRHFSTCTASGEAVPKGGALHGLRHLPRLVTVALRDENGAPCSNQKIAAACEAAIAASLTASHVVLHAIDGSKTGLAAPDRPTLLRLARRFGPSLDIVVDACQARIEPALIRWYLQQGFPVLVTGSKFFAAPGFCGAVLFPRARLGRIASSALPSGLASYAGLADGVGSRLCPGLILRWTAALQSMAAFGRMPAGEVGLRLDRLGQTIEQYLHRDTRCRLVAAPRPAGQGWSDKRSVFTFMVRGHAGWLDTARLRSLYLALHDDVSADVSHAALRCQIGQPVQLGTPALGGLRLALSAAQVCQDGHQAAVLEAVTDKLRYLLDRSDLSEKTHESAEPALAAD